jgi:hypothetical protein
MNVCIIRPAAIARTAALLLAASAIVTLPSRDGALGAGTGDTDQDGCTDKAELQTAPGSETSGGLRDPNNFWDFFDTPDNSNQRNKVVAGADFFRVLARFGSSGDPGGDPLSLPPPAPAYHTAFDRGPSSGPNTWNLTAANGAIAGTDFFAFLEQFGHSCS